MTTYVCKVLDGTGCVQWVTNDSASVLHELAITKVDAYIIGGGVSGVLALILAFVIVAKALKSL